MTQAGCKRIKLKPGSRQRVKEWAQTLSDRNSEVFATLRDEGVSVESVFLEQAPDGDYLIYYMRAKDLKLATGKAIQSDREIDKYHQNFKKETWAESSKLELLVDFELKESAV